MHLVSIIPMFALTLLVRQAANPSLPADVGKMTITAEAMPSSTIMDRKPAFLGTLGVVSRT